MSSVSTQPIHHNQPDSDVSTQPNAPWVVIVWNDPVNLMNYVAYVFESYFGFSQEKAHTLMMQVHREGRAVVASGSREKIEFDVQAMHGYGLWATMQRSDA
ncbi:ATP-dependent Clp protease adapter ClpS [Timonella sp. A28]|uniref:ATP-dependent Clp protease adapter ClpS n=1 Tax=Timonella sp. A28 TaxID=3442640 RepID=UPI003EBFEE89